MGAFVLGLLLLSFGVHGMIGTIGREENFLGPAWPWIGSTVAGSLLLAYIVGMCATLNPISGCIP